MHPPKLIADLLSIHFVAIVACSVMAELEKADV